MKNLLENSTSSIFKKRLIKSLVVKFVLYSYSTSFLFRLLSSTLLLHG